MNKLYILRIIVGIVSVLSVSNSERADEFYDDTFGDDDDLQNNNAMINVRLYTNYSDCFKQQNSMYYYHKNFNIECDCFKINSCFDTLKDSKKLEDYSFKYNNYSYNLNELNFTDQCYIKNNVYVYNELNIYQYCGIRIFLFVFALIIIISCIIANSNFFMKKRNKKYRHNLTNKSSPPDYNTLN